MLPWHERRNKYIKQAKWKTALVGPISWGLCSSFEFFLQASELCLDLLTNTLISSERYISSSGISYTRHTCTALQRHVDTNSCD